jgi:ubiquinone/menaquinone biosynthesis C-methylase UbiE
MNNYEFCADWVASRSPKRALDYGCGAGEIVRLLRSRGVESFGCDVFYEGGSLERSIPESIRSYISKMTDRIPFEDASFDAIVSNTVLEHVPSIDDVLSEMRRVLAPGGFVLSFFPHLEVWNEGHCGIPFLHRFPKGSRARVYYAATARAIGLGYNKDGKSVMEWSRFQCQWLDDWTHYRRLKEIERAYSKHFAKTEHIEADWLRERYRASAKLPAILRRFIARKGAGLVLVSH